MARGILDHLRDRGQITIVPMEEIKFISFTQIEAIGTEGLGSCSVVVIASPYGAILAHIPPHPFPPSPDPYAGDRNCQHMMDLVIQSYNEHINYFGFDNDTVVVCAWINEGVGLPDQVRIMEQSLQRVGLRPRIRSYHVPGNRSAAGQGTVVVERSPVNHGRPRIYLEDHLV